MEFEATNEIATLVNGATGPTMGFYIPTNKRNQLLKYKYSSTDKSLTSVSHRPRFRLTLELECGVMYSA